VRTHTLSIGRRFDGKRRVLKREDARPVVRRRHNFPKPYVIRPVEGH
jgi:hypothetical protein